MIPDDRLRLVFTCCHPALAREAQVALTLRLVCGVTTADIAHAFLVSEPTLAARLTRAKKKIAAASIPYVVPGPEDLPERLDAVLTVVHLLSTTGHTAPSGDALVRVDLADRALDLARMLRVLLPEEREVGGLLALLLVHQARAASRVDSGRLVRLEDQDRSSWDGALIAEADQLIVGRPVRRARRDGSRSRRRSRRSTRPRPATRRRIGRSCWRSTTRCCASGRRRWSRSNRAVVVAMVSGPAAALDEVEALERDGRLGAYRYLPSTKADLLRRLGRHEEAGKAYRDALSLTENSAEREFLFGRLGGANS